MRILVVDDDFASRRVLQRYLEPWGEVDAALDGGSCLEAFRKGIEEGAPYRLVFLDIVMPGMNGHEALRELRVIETDLKVEPRDEVKVVMTSALEDPYNVMKAYNEGGAAGYLVKPVSKQSLEAELLRLGYERGS